MLNKKKSRPFSKDQRKYRYIVSTTEISDGHYKLNLTIQSDETEGVALTVDGLVTRDFWLDFSEVGSEKDYPVLLPRHIDQIVQRALDAGWNPASPGKPFRLELENEELFKVGA